MSDFQQRVYESADRDRLRARVVELEDYIYVLLQEIDDWREAMKALAKARQ